jgi:hypothetical protein
MRALTRKLSATCSKLTVPVTWLPAVGDSTACALSGLATAISGEQSMQHIIASFIFFFL